jgi:hypothetical protein
MSLRASVRLYVHNGIEGGTDGAEQTSTSFKSISEDLHDPPLYRPLEPVQVLAQPAFDTVPTSSGESDALHVIINQEAFISPDRAHEAKLDPPQVYLGDIGPLTCSIMQSTSRTDESICPLIVHPAYAESSEEERHARSLRSLSDFPSKIPHLLLHLSLPPVRDIAQALNDLARTTGSDPLPSQPPPAAPPAQDPLPPQASSSTHDLPPPSDLEAQLTDLDTNLAFEQALNEPNWLADYNNAVQSLDVEMDDTEAIRLALQNVQDVQDAQDAVRAAQLADAAVVAAATAAAEAIDPVLAGLTAEGQGGHADHGAVELDRSIQDLEPSAAAAQTPLARNPASAASTAEPVVLTTSTNETIGDSAQAGPVLLTPVTDRYTTAQGGRLALPILVARVGEGVDVAIFRAGYGVAVDSLGELEIVTIA